MALENRVESLRQKHAELEAKISELMSHPSADDLEIRRLKVEKLKIKEELDGLSRTNGSGH